MKRISVVLIFLIGALSVILNAPQYELEYKYKNGDLRVILNGTEITRDKTKLPEVAIIKNGEVMLSSNTIDILFDKDLYYEEKYKTFITTSENHRADIELGSHMIKIDGAEKTTREATFKDVYDYSKDDRYNGNAKKDVYYIAIKDLEDVYDIDVVFKDKVIINSRNINLSNIVIDDDKIAEIKYSGDSYYKTIDKAQIGDTVYIYDYNPADKFSKVLSPNGELGYLTNEFINQYNVVQIYTKKEAVKEMPQNITLVWDYINPIATNVENKTSRGKVDQIDVISPTLIYLKDSTGELYYNKSNISSYVKWAKACDYEVWATVKNERINDTQNFTIDDTHDFLTNMRSREKTIKELVSVCKYYGIDGIDVDFENIYKEDATALSQFVRELAVECKNNNLVLCVCTNIPDGSDTWSLCYQHKSLSEAADYIALMTYDYSKSAVSSFAPFEWVEDNVRKVTLRDNVESTKVLLGISFGSASWKVTDGTPSRSVISMAYAKKYVDNNWNEELKQYVYENASKTEAIYIEEEESIKAKLELIDKYNLGGSGSWQLGQESISVWSAFED